jgi:hypothetical protein
VIASKRLHEPLVWGVEVSGNETFTCHMLITAYRHASLIVVEVLIESLATSTSPFCHSSQEKLK